MPTFKRSIPRGSRRQTEWAAIVGNISVPANTAVQVGSFATADLRDVLPATLIRVRGVVGISVPTNADGSIRGAFGIAVVGEPASVAGVASLPTPLTEAASDQWLYWTALNMIWDFQSASGFTSTAQIRIPVDSKGMRKIVDGEAITLVVETAGSSGLAQFAMGLRFLFKTH